MYHHLFREDHFIFIFRIKIHSLDDKVFVKTYLFILTYDGVSCKTYAHWRTRQYYWWIL